MPLVLAGLVSFGALVSRSPDKRVRLTGRTTYQDHISPVGFCDLRKSRIDLGGRSARAEFELLGFLACRLCRFATTPGSNIPLWASKFEETIRRDARNVEALHKLGWRVAVVWECTINEEGEQVIANKLARWLATRWSYAEIPSPKRSSRPWRRSFSGRLQQR